MGATPWQEMAPWRPDPKNALEALQAEFVTHAYDLPSLVRDHLESARNAVQLTTAEGDHFGLLRGYRQMLVFLEQVSRAPLPAKPRDRIMLVRKLYEHGGEGIGDVLDVLSVSDEGGVFVSRRLREAEIIRLFGTATPDHSMAQQALGMLAKELGRAESVCFPVFDGNGNPVGWWFAGYSAD